jgi:general secretion pathway protein D
MINGTAAEDGFSFQRNKKVTPCHKVVLQPPTIKTIQLKDERIRLGVCRQLEHSNFWLTIKSYPFVKHILCEKRHLRDAGPNIGLPKALLLLMTAALSSCQSPSVPAGRSGWEGTQSTRSPYANNPGLRPSGQSREISLLSPQAAQNNGPVFEAQGDKVTLNLVNAPITVAAKAIFADILKSNFSIDSGVSGNVTIQTARPTSKQALVDIFEAILRQRGYGITKKSGAFIISTTDPMHTGSITPTDGSQITAGRQARIVPLNFISPKQMAEILKPVAADGVLQIDERRNIIVLTGSNAEIEGMLDSIRLFDVDWMRGMSASLFPIDSGADPAIIVKQLQSLFYATSGSEADSGAVKFLPSRELKAILVISPRPVYLDRARALIDKLDDAASYGTKQTFVYRVQNRNAKDLGAVLQKALGGGLSASSQMSQTIQSDTQRSESSLDVTSEGSGLASDISVVADDSNNSLVIVASKRDYNRILGMLSSLDKMPSQVLIEAVIAEAALNDNLKFGLRYSIGTGHVFKFTNDDDGQITQNTSGFSYSMLTSNFSVALNALSSITDVKVLSSPTLTVLDNHTAKLQVGDQVPIISESSTSDTTGTTTTSIQMKDTGVILDVTPRISSNGHILLDIVQEVSDVVNTTTSTINSPTIRQRKVSSTVEVGDGQSIVIGGLVQDQQQKATDSIPILGKLPVIGPAFRSRNNQAKRTELMIFIRTRIMRDQNDAQAITNEFRSGLKSVTMTRPTVQSSGTWDLLRMME